MRYLPKSPADREAMLRDIGAKNIDELFSHIPAEYRLRRDLKIPTQRSESEIVDYFRARAAENAVRHLIELGHRRIGHLGGPRTLRVGQSRLEGYRAALAGAGLPIDPALEVEGTLMAHGSAEAGLVLLAAQPPPTAIFCANDAMALQVHFVIRQRGVSAQWECHVVLHCQ